MISNYIHYKVWEEISYRFPNFNGAKVSKTSSVMHFVVRENRNLSGKSQIILWRLIDGHPKVILIEVLDSTTSPSNSIALKCKIPHYPAHTNSCIFFMSITNLVQTVANFCLEKATFPLWICLKLKLSPTKDCLDLLYNMEMWTNMPWFSGVSTPISEPTISWICALNPQMKCRFV